MKICDVLVSKDGPVLLFRIDSQAADPATPLFNFRLSGSQTYFVREKALPFEPLIPNAETIAAIEAARRGELEEVTLEQLQAVLDADD
ncbi:MAG: type II toxin-antitoxin system RelB/DinJ family antitoxin [Rhodospirillales bacterium]|nr:type II toxin-antitoxin system RelB/DinJ family antitoxin [Rhodospirillales bacterium]